MAGRVDDVDQVVAPLDGAVLGADGDAAFAFDLVVVHDAFLDVLVGAEGVRVAEDRIDQRGLAVVDVRDDRQITNLVH